MFFPPLKEVEADSFQPNTVTRTGSRMLQQTVLQWRGPELTVLDSAQWNFSDQCTNPRLSQQKIVHFILYLVLLLCRLPNWKGLQQMDHWQTCRDHLIKWCPLGQHSGPWKFIAGFSLHRNMEDVNELASLLPVNVGWIYLTKKYIHL